MGRKSIEVEVNPTVLKWARESAGINEEEVAKRLGEREDINIVLGLEVGDKVPTLTQLKELAGLYKRPLGAFLLAEPPKEPPMPKDFRMLPFGEEVPFTKKTYFAVRKARWLRDKALEIADELGLKAEPIINSINIDEDPEKIAVIERERSGIPITAQKQWKDDYEAFSNWRSKLAKVNILLFQMQIPAEEMSGFSIIGNRYPVIAVTTSDHIRRRIFSIFHEYAHVLLGISGICIPKGTYPSGDTHSREIENFCDRFAESFLIPETEFLKDDKVQRLITNEELPDVIINNLVNDYKVSKYVILYRLLHTALITRRQFTEKFEAWQTETPEKPKGRRGVSRPERCVKYIGPFFTSMVLDAQSKGIITLSDVTDYLSIRPTEISKVEALLAGAR